MRKPLRVAVISTGDELVDPGEPAGLGQIYDANRPMLLALIRQFGFETVDMGRIKDDRAALGEALDQAAVQADVILTSGGASAGRRTMCRLCCARLARCRSGASR